jgi:hypothetical protein
MEDNRTRRVGNIMPDAIHKQLAPDPTNPDKLLPSFAEQWSARGILYRETDPVATEFYTSEELRGFGLIGVELIFPE